jgi:uncharacterized Zn finger protein
MHIPFAHVLHVERVRALAGGAAFERGERYFRDRRVIEVSRRGGTVYGVVRGERSYRVRVWVKGDGLAYRCDCPVGVEGNFCKHCVATALAWLAESPRDGELEELETALEACDRSRLIALLVELARDDALVARRLLRQLNE